MISKNSEQRFVNAQRIAKAITSGNNNALQLTLGDLAMEVSESEYSHLIGMAKNMITPELRSHAVFAN